MGVRELGQAASQRFILRAVLSSKSGVSRASARTMSRPKVKKIYKREEKGRPKDKVDEKKVGKAGDEGKKSGGNEEGGWSDWFWDEGLKVYYRARRGNGGEYFIFLHTTTANGPVLMTTNRGMDI